MLTQGNCPPRFLPEQNNTTKHCTSTTITVYKEEGVSSESIKVPDNMIPDTLMTVISPMKPFFYLVNTKREFPRVDGDAAQEYIVDSLGLDKKCKENPKTIVVDIGGFLGDFGLRAAAFGCQVYIFEPLPQQYWLIKSSVELNGFGDRVHVFNYAISNSERFTAFKDLGGQTKEITDLSKIDKFDPNIFFIKTVTLDSILPTEHIYLLKVDVEGFEPTVLFGGCKNILSERRVHHIISEYTAFWTNEGKGPWTNFMDNLMYYGTENTTIYALHRQMGYVYGPIDRGTFQSFHNSHVTQKLQTDIYVDVFGSKQVNAISTWVPTAFA
jgi:FkbM family methyltransferase